MNLNRYFRKTIKSGFLSAVLLVLVACAGNTGYRNVSVTDLRNANEANRIVLDVRQPSEYSEGHVPGSRLVPLGKLESRLNEVPNDVPVYVICRSGNRSKTASQLLAAKGKQDVRNVEGGMIAWQNAGYPVEHQ